MSSSEESSSEEVDLEIYRNKFESEEHWNLRKVFVYIQLAMLKVF